MADQVSEELSKISEEMSSLILNLYQSDIDNIRAALETATGEEAEMLQKKLGEIEEKMEMEKENQRGLCYTLSATIIYYAFK